MKQLAIIGMGPRGLYALEQLLMQLGQLNKQVSIFIFEVFDEPGASQVWNIKQPDTNWINTSERALVTLKRRPKITYKSIIIESFPSYHKWCDFHQTEDQPDRFPPRSKLGKYLNERYQSLHKSLEALDTFKYINAKVLNVTFENKQLKIKTHHSTWLCDAILLTIGHQKTALSEELKTWKAHSKSNNSLYFFEDTYSIDQFREIKNRTHLTIGIRGFGLTMIDLMRYLVINNFGNFKIVNNATFETIYYKVKLQHLKLIPFSSFGLPLVPKPLNTTIDNWYKPTTEELNRFKKIIKSNVYTKTEIGSISFLTQPFAQIAARVFMDLNEKAIAHSFHTSEIETIILNTLDTADYKHELLQDETISTYKLIQQYIEMALGNLPVSLDYCMGQVWRHCQPSFYNVFSYATLNSETIEAMIGLNERSKRYSYGPPIESMQQILALVDADILTLDYVKNPEISMVNDGWLFKNKQHKNALCSILINSVLEDPKLLKTKTLLIKGLLKTELIKPIHPEHGIAISNNGYVKHNQNIPIAVLGRMAKGSVIGVDSISECFGPRTEDWAKFYAQNVEN